MGRFYLGTLTLIAGMLMAGCGGAAKSHAPSSSSAQPASVATTQTESGPPTPPTSLLSKTKLIAMADKICAGINTKRLSFRIQTPREYATYLVPLAAYEHAAVSEIARLTPPASLARDWSQIVSDVRMINVNVAKSAQYASREDFASMRAMLDAAKRVQRTMVAIARRDGFKQCSQPS